MIDCWGTSCKIALRWMPMDLTGENSTLVQVMAWCRQATSHYLSHCWPRSMSPYGITRPQWVKTWSILFKIPKVNTPLFTKEGQISDIYCDYEVNCLVQDCSISSTLVVEILQCSIKLLNYDLCVLSLQLPCCMQYRVIKDSILMRSGHTIYNAELYPFQCHLWI